MTALANISKTVEEMQYLIALNGYGLPAAYVDAATLETIRLDYSEGYPTIDGVPFWERLEGETTEQYELFKTYRNLKEVQGTRSLAATAAASSVPFKELRTTSGLFHWQWRVKAYDKYIENLVSLRRAHDIKQLENRHYEAAEKVFKKCIDFFENNVDNLTPKTALGWLEMAIKLERLSIGLSPEKPLQEISQPGTVVNINNSDGTTSIATNGRGTPDASKVQEIIQILNISGALQIDAKGVSLDEYREDDELEPVKDLAEVIDAEIEQVHSARPDTQTNCVPFIRE